MAKKSKKTVDVVEVPDMSNNAGLGNQPKIDDSAEPVAKVLEFDAPPAKVTMASKMRDFVEKYPQATISEVAKHFDVPYQSAFQVLRNIVQTQTRSRGPSARALDIRAFILEEGHTRKEAMLHFKCSYQIIYHALKVTKALDAK